MSTLIQFHVDARSSADTARLAEAAERLFREHVVGKVDLDSSLVRPERRGGLIMFTVTLPGLDRTATMNGLRALSDAIEKNANLIERVNEYRAAASSDSKIVGFVQGDFRGWLRDEAIKDLREAV